MTTATLPAVRGKLTAKAPLAPLVWFKSGGPADWLFEPKDADDLASFMRDAGRAGAGDGAGARIEPDRSRRRGAGRRCPSREGVCEGRALSMP